MPEKNRPAFTVKPQGSAVGWMNPSSTPTELSRSKARVRLAKTAWSALALRLTSLSPRPTPRGGGLASLPRNTPGTLQLSGLWFDVIAVPLRTAPIAGLKAAALACVPPAAAGAGAGAAAATGAGAACAVVAACCAALAWALASAAAASAASTRFSMSLSFVSY